MIASWSISEILSVLILLITGLYLYYKFHVFTFWHKRTVFYLQPTFITGNILPLLTGKVSQEEENLLEWEAPQAILSFLGFTAPTADPLYLFMTCFKEPLVLPILADQSWANYRFFLDVYEKSKNHRVAGVYMLHKPYLLVNDPDLIRDVLTRNFPSFHDRGVYCNEEVDPLTGHLFSLPGKKWRNLRVKLTPTFTSGKMKQMFPIMKETGDSLAKYLNDKAQSREIIDVKEIFARYSTDIIMSVAFGLTCDSLKNPDNELRYWGKRIFNPRLLWNSLVFWAPQVLDLLSLPYTEKPVTKFFLTMFEDTVNYRDANNIVRKDFLNLLMQLMKNGYVDPDDNESADVEKVEENKLKMKEAAAQAYVFFLAGFETSSTTAALCLYELAKYQDIQDKLREEIQTIIEKHGELSYNAINDMTYLQKVVSETMRKYPALPFLNRICTKEIQLEGTNFRLPEGTPVVIPIHGLHLDPNIYPDPDKFDPERFSDQSIRDRHSYTYLPFGEGPRVCIGLRFGLLQTKMGIISALLKNRIKRTADTPDPLEFQSGSIVLLAKDNINLHIEPV